MNKILFICPIPPPVGGQAVISKLVYDHINPTYLINTNIGRRGRHFIIIIEIIFRLIFSKVDLVYFTCSRTRLGAIKDLVALAICRIKNIKVINHLHGNDFDDLLKGKLFSRVVRYFYTHVSLTIFVSKFQLERFPSFFENTKKTVVQNCYDPVMDNIESFSYPKNHKNCINLLFISYIQKSKGILETLDAFNSICEKHDNIILNIAGAPLGDYLLNKEEITQQFTTRFKNIDNLYPGHIKYHGVVSGVEKINLYSNCDILIFPTFHRGESFGLVIVEGMRAGMAIISTYHNNIPNLVSPKEGLLVEPQSTKSLESAITQYIQNIDYLVSVMRHNNIYAKTTYSPEKFESEIKTCFNSVL